MKLNDKKSLACTTCAKAKARCIPGPVGDGDCERCHRLGKTCLSRTPAPPRPKKQLKRSRVAELEKRLSELEGCGGQDLHQNYHHDHHHRHDRHQHHHHNQQHQQQQHPCHDQPQNASMSASSISEENGHQTATPETSIEGDKATPPPAVTQRKKNQVPVNMSFDHIFPGTETSSWPSKESVASSLRDKPWEMLWPQAAEAEVLLAMYTDTLADAFPFVVVPEMKASEMKVQRPFLWKAIMMAACFLDGARHERLGEELLAEISKATMIDGVKSLDLLQGLQVLVVWFHCALKSSRMTNLLFLCRSLCSSLGLGLSDNQTASENASARNLDPLRAYAGTYYVNTLVFTTNKRSEVLMSTGYLDRCCSILEEAKQFESDELLVAIIRAQKLAQSISQTLAMEHVRQPMQLPMTMVVQSFQDQIYSLQRSLSSEIASTPLMISHFTIAEILLTEWAISDRHCNAANMLQTDRLRLLWSCVRSLRVFFVNRANVWDDLDNLKFHCLHGSDVSYVLITSVRLVTLRLPGWDLEQIEQELQFEEIMAKVIGHLTELSERRCSGALSTALGNHEAKDPIRALADLCTHMRGLVRVEMARALEDSKQGCYAAATPPLEPPPMMADAGEQILTDEYWNQFMNDAFWSNSGDMTGFEL